MKSTATSTARFVAMAAFLLSVLSISSAESSHTKHAHKVPVLFAAEFAEFFEVSAGYINIIGGLILVYAAGRAIFHVTINSLLHLFGAKEFMSMDENRISLGNTIAFSLELLITSDVIETLTKATEEISMEVLYKIGLIVIIRTVLSYFLGKELEELEHHKHEHEEKKKQH